MPGQPSTPTPDLRAVRALLGAPVEAGAGGASQAGTASVAPVWGDTLAVRTSSAEWTTAHGGAPAIDLPVEGAGEQAARRAARVVAEVRVASGAGAGTIAGLPPGRYAVGSGPSCTIVVEDPRVPDIAAWLVVDAAGVSIEVTTAARRRRREQAVRIRRSPGPAQVAPPDATTSTPSGGADEIDPDAVQPLVRLARRPIGRRTNWAPGVQLGVGEALLELALAPQAPVAETAPADVARPPRVLAEPRQGRFVLPDPDERAGQGSRWGRQGREHARAHRHDVRAVEGRARAALAAEPGARTEELPDAGTVLRTVLARAPRLWERRRGDPDWLVLRVGTGDVPSEVGLVAADRRRIVRRWTAADVPVAVDVDRLGAVGLAGPATVRSRLASWLLAQVLAHHAPADVRVSLLDDAAGREAGAPDPWAWARDLPHLRPPAPTSIFALPPRPDPSVPPLLAELERLCDLLQERRIQARSAPKMTFDPVLVVIDAPARLRLLPQTLTLIKDGPAVGFRFLWLDDDPELLPRECGATVELAPPLLTVTAAGAPVAELVRPDLPDPEWFAQLAEGLRDLREAAEGEEVALPTQARLLSLLDLDPPSAQKILHGWLVGSGRTTTALLGEGTRGPFEVDLRRDGPHALVAGTVGSGRSELLQTLIASLAVGNRPDELAFVLVDHGGGGAFADCVRLPHTIGVVTDLDPHLVARALASLTAELRRRQRLLNRASVKDIHEYQAGRDTALLAEGRAGRLPSGHPFAERMPRLVLVVDEFASIARELPDFLSGLVDVARLGRSRGVHLILATERPSGLVSEEIARAVRLRIALRLTEAADSGDVVDDAAAAGIDPSTPGRGYARLHDSDLYAFQGARIAGTAPGPHLRGIPRSDLALLVDAVRAAADDAGIAPVPRPWLAPLPAAVQFDDLPAQPRPGIPHPGPKARRLVGVDRRSRPGDVAPLRFGLADLPSAQHQDVAVHDVARGSHLVVAGPRGAGHVTLLRALGAALARDTSPDDVRLSVVDPTGRLAALGSLPHTDRIVAAGDAAALAAELLAEVARRREVLERQHLADVPDQRARAGAGQAWPYLLVVLDGWDDLLGEGDAALDATTWRRLLLEGPRAGVRVVLSGGATDPTSQGLPPVDDVLLLPGTDDLPVAGLGPVDGVVVVPHVPPPGRAVRTTPPRVTPARAARATPARGRSGRIAVDRSERGGQRGLPAHEVQIAVLAADPDPGVQDARLRRLGDEARRRYARSR